MCVQRGAPRSLRPENRSVSDQVLQRVVPASDPHKARADEGRGEIHQGATQEC
jgi:hypothetical protein